MASNPPVVSVSRYWHGGSDSWTIPDQLKDTEYVFGVNVANRGGVIQTRPGTEVVYCLPEGRPQGLIVFTPITGLPHLVAAVDGKIYVSPAPFTFFRQLPGIQFAADSRFVVFESCVKSTDYAANGELFFHTPYEVLIIADGRTRMAFWDGSVSRHLNPTESMGTLTEEGKDETKIGLWMKWSGNRLWVNRGKQWFASDHGNPLKFTENQYFNEAKAFYTNGEGMGMVDIPRSGDQAGGMLAIHSKGVDFFKTSIEDRTAWLVSSNEFQQPITELSCVAPRSIIRQHGLVYWFSPAGLVSINDALRANISSELIPMDQEMAWSKSMIGPDLTDICCAAFENYLLVSVPWCNVRNTHTWAMDLAVFEDGGNSWNGVWTGWRPVQWATGNFGGQSRCFFLSADTDGQNRVWEAFTSDRKDNGCAITCSAQFRLDPIKSLERKRSFFAKIRAMQVLGDVSVMAAVAGWRGWFDRILTKEIVATEGRINTETTYGDGTTNPKLGENRTQSRTLVTETWTTPSDCNECGVESNDLNSEDTHYQLFVAWSGRFGIRQIELFAVEQMESKSSQCEEDETGIKVLMGSGCAATEEHPNKESFPVFTSTKTHTVTDIAFVAGSISVTKTATSQISQVDADRKALCWAVNTVRQLFSSQLLADGGLPAIVTDEIEVIPVSAILAIFLPDGTEVTSVVDFGTVEYGETEDIVLTLKNIGLTTLNLGTISISGSGYSIVSGPGVTTLDPDETTTLTVRFDA